MLHEEIIYSNDINKDSQNGDIVTKTLVEGEVLSLYQTKSNSFIIDSIGLKNNDSVKDPTLLKTVSFKKNQQIVKLYSVKYEPLELVSDSSGII